MATELSNYERETVINFNDEEKVAVVYTCNRALRRKMDKLAEERPDECRTVTSFENSATYEVPKKWVKVSPPRFVSDEQKEAIRARSNAMWAEKRAAKEQDGA